MNDLENECSLSGGDNHSWWGHSTPTYCFENIRAFYTLRQWGCKMLCASLHNKPWALELVPMSHLVKLLLPTYFHLSSSVATNKRTSHRKLILLKNEGLITYSFTFCFQINWNQKNFTVSINMTLVSFVHGEQERTISKEQYPGGEI